MKAVLTGDIIASRAQDSPDLFLNRLKKLFGKWGKSPKTWQIYRGDSFQLEIAPEDALKAAFQIKSILKSTEMTGQSNTSSLDARIAIGIGEKSYASSKVSESNGEAFVNSGTQFEKLKEEKTTLAIKSPWEEFDKEINLYLKLILIVLDKWTVKSAELVNILFENENLNQSEIGKKLGIDQSSVSGRMKRAHIDEVMELEALYRYKINKLIK